MDAPPKLLSPEKFNAWLKAERTKRYAQLKGLTICRRCSKEVVFVPCAVSIHYAGWKECTGDGDVERLDLEFCPKCEVVPKSLSTCIHRPGYTGRFGSLEATNRPTWWDQIRKFLGKIP